MAEPRIRSADGEHERGIRRLRRASKATLVSLLARVVTGVVGLVVTPLVVVALGKSSFGMWAAVGSLLVWAAPLDLGFSRRLQIDVAAARAGEDVDAAKSAVATTFWALAGVAIALFVVGASVGSCIPWHEVLNIPVVRDEPLELTLLVALAGFCALLPLSAVWATFTALQDAAKVHLLGMASALLTFALTLGLLAIAPRSAALPLYVAAGPVAGVVVGVVGAVVLLRSGWASLSWRRADIRLPRMLKGGAPMALVQLAALAINESQVLTLTRAHGVDAAADYAVYARLFALQAFVVNAIDAGSGAAFRDAWIRNDTAWLARAFRGTLGLKVAVAVAVSVVGIVAGGWGSRRLSAGHVDLELAVWCAAAAQLVVSAWTSSFLNLFVAFDRMKAMSLTVVVNAIVTLPLVVVLGSLEGVAGSIVGTVAFSALVATLWMPWLLRDDLRRTGLWPPTRLIRG